MKILIISHEYPPVGGGGANACMNLARQYAKAGHIVEIITVWYRELEEIVREGNVTIYRVKSKRQYAEHCNFFEMLDFLLKAKPVASRLVREEGFDICQVFFGIPSGPLGLYLKKKYKLPYVIRFGGGDIPGFQDRFTRVYRLIGPAIKVVWDKADSLVANSSGLKRMALSFYDKNRVLVIPNGVDVNAFSETDELSDSSQLKVAGDDSVVHLLFVSRLIERKGLQDVLPQLRKIRDICLENEKTIVLDVVGDGPYADTLKTKAHDEKIDDFVVFHGQKNKSELPSFYSQADIFIFPSRKEGMPNAVLEAMSYGLPIVMTPCEGSDELIRGNGYVCNVDDFKDRIIELSLSAELRNKMGNKSIELVKKSFSWQKTADEYLALFERIKKSLI